MDYHTAHIDDMAWHEDPRFPDVAVQVLISKIHTDAASLMRGQVAPGGEIAKHTHETETELVYVLAGTATMTINEDTFPLPTGSAVLIPAGMPHSLKNNGDTVIQLMAVHTPPTR